MRADSDAVCWAEGQSFILGAVVLQVDSDVKIVAWHLLLGKITSEGRKMCLHIEAYWISPCTWLLVGKGANSFHKYKVASESFETVLVMTVLDSRFTHDYWTADSHRS